jgi:hypothetical protein
MKLETIRIGFGISMLSAIIISEIIGISEKSFRTGITIFCALVVAHCCFYFAVLLFSGVLERKEKE